MRTNRKSPTGKDIKKEKPFKLRQIANEAKAECDFVWSQRGKNKRKSDTFRVYSKMSKSAVLAEVSVPE